jgi:hypothetical protein
LDRIEVEEEDNSSSGVSAVLECGSNQSLLEYYYPTISFSANNATEQQTKKVKSANGKSSSVSGEKQERGFAVSASSRRSSRDD